jgi:hypothetical protein
VASGFRDENVRVREGIGMPMDKREGGEKKNNKGNMK